MKTFAPIMLVFALLTYTAHRRLHAIDRPATSVEETLPATAALQWLSIGYKSFVADYYWLRAIGHFGDTAMHEHGYPNLAPFLHRVLTLDPYFVSGYFMAGTALTLKGMDANTSVMLLKRGLQHRPDQWRIPYFLGFNLYYFLHDYPAAAQALAKAARHPDAPVYTGALASRLAAEAGEPEAGLALVQSILPNITDDGLREVYEERRQLLLLEVEFKQLTQIVQQFADIQARPANRLQELVDAQLLNTLPTADPLGGEYYLHNGTLHTTSEEARLRLHTIAKGQR